MKGKSVKLKETYESLKIHMKSIRPKITFDFEIDIPENLLKENQKNPIPFSDAVNTLKKLNEEDREIEANELTRVLFLALLNWSSEMQEELTKAALLIDNIAAMQQ